MDGSTIGAVRNWRTSDWCLLLLQPADRCAVSQVWLPGRRTCPTNCAHCGVGGVIAHDRSKTGTLAVLFPVTAALKRRSFLVLRGRYRVGGSAYRLADFVSKTIPAC